MNRRISFLACLGAIFAAGLAVASLTANSAASPLHQSGCHAVHSCPSDHHTYVWFNPSSGQGWDCVEPGAREYNPSLDRTTIVWEGLTYYCRSAGGTTPPTTTTTTPIATTSPDAQCGVERWAVKTLSDPAVANVNFNPVAASVSALRSLGAPNVSSSTPRITGVETTSYVITARLVQMKLEDDRDIHLVVADPVSGGTMIVEFPDTSCSGASTSARMSEMAAARASLVAAEGTPSSSSFRALTGLATITGVGFFDEIHGQTGVAPNGIELHPVLNFSIGVVTTTDSTSSTVPAARPSLSVSPKSVRAGGTVKVSGSADGCAVGNTIFVLSRAFVHRHQFAGVPAVLAKVQPGGAFQAETTIPRSRKPGRYVVTGRCGGGNLGVSVRLRVRSRR